MDCQIDLDYSYDGADFYTLQQKTVIARKPHICGECGGKILPGQKYEIYKIAQDRTILTEKTCLDCLSLRDSFYPCNWMFGNIIDEITEQVKEELHGQVSAECILPLTDKAKDFVFGLIEEAWDESGGGQKPRD